MRLRRVGKTGRSVGETDKIQVVIPSPNRSEWNLVMDASVVFSHKSIFIVLKEANRRA